MNFEKQSIENAELLFGEVIPMSERANVCTADDVRTANKERTGGAV